MSGEIVAVADTGLALTQSAVARAQAYQRASRSRGTMRVYAGDWRRLCRLVRGSGRHSPPRSAGCRGRR